MNISGELFIPQASPKLRLARRELEIADAIESVLTAGSFILGPNNKRFEEDFAAYLRSRNCIGVSSGTDALVLALQALRVGSNDHVLIPAMSAPATDYCRKLSPGGGGLDLTQIPIFADAVWDGAGPLYNDTPVTHKGWVAGGSLAAGMSNFSIPRHPGRTPVDMTFLDTSVRSVGIKQLWTLKWSRSFNTSYETSLNSWPAWMNGYQ